MIKNIPLYEAFGKKKSIVDWAKEYNIKYPALYYRFIINKTPLEEALKEPLKGKKLYRAFNQDKTLKEWSQVTDIQLGTLKDRIINNEWNIEKALTVPSNNKFEKHINKIYDNIKILDVYSKEINQNKYNISTAICLCLYRDCGNIFETSISHASDGHTGSCGCKLKYVTSQRARTHGLSSHVLRGIWEGMIRRCNDPKNNRYEIYGGLGITIADEWKRGQTNNQGLFNFIQWGIKQAKYQGITEEELLSAKNEGGKNRKWTIERIDVYGNYEPSNCKWATYQEQALNKR